MNPNFDEVSELNVDADGDKPLVHHIELNAGRVDKRNIAENIQIYTIDSRAMY